MWNIILRSLEACYEGSWPTHDRTTVEYDTNSAEDMLGGTELAAGFFGSVDFQCNYFQIETYIHLLKVTNFLFFNENHHNHVSV